MKVFISYSERDREFALQLKERLSNEKNIKIYFDEHSLEMGGNIERIMMRKLEEFDYYLIVLSKYSVKSKYLMIELDRVVFREIKSEKQTIIPIAIDEYAFEFPVLREFSRRQLIDFSKSFDNGYKGLIKRLNQDQQQKLAIKEFNPEETKKINDNYLKEIKEEFKKGSLCLFCGAGVSIKAGIPNWSFLLKGLLQNLVDKQLGDFSIDPKKQRQLAEFYYDEFGVSSLIVGQYLKNGLGESFLEDVREALYQNNPSDSDILNTIVELCRPQRERKTLYSIITFNFDDLIEKNFI
ncbi:MAG: TIR domain-containing protein, partial [Saprospiraceae bacterium]